MKPYGSKAKIESNSLDLVMFSSKIKNNFQRKLVITQLNLPSFEQEGKVSYGE